jgi:hypothetical protein
MAMSSILGLNLGILSMCGFVRKDFVCKMTHAAAELNCAG